MLHQTKQHYKTVITHPCQLLTEYAIRKDPRDGVREPTAPPTYLGSSGTWTQGGNTTSNRSRSILETTVSTLSWSRRSNFAINCFPSYLVENINMLNSFIKIIVICDKIFIKMGLFFLQSHTMIADGKEFEYMCQTLPYLPMEPSVIPAKYK